MTRLVMWEHQQIWEKFAFRVWVGSLQQVLLAAMWTQVPTHIFHHYFTKNKLLKVPKGIQNKFYKNWRSGVMISTLLSCGVYRYYSPWCKMVWVVGLQRSQDRSATSQDCFTTSKDIPRLLHNVSRLSHVRSYEPSFHAPVAASHR